MLALRRPSSTGARRARHRYSLTEVLQAAGRAGRPQFDDTGVCVVMTQPDLAARYENMLVGSETVESRMHDQLVRHLNAEIASGYVTDLDAAATWLHSTYLLTRIRHSPAKYKLPGGLTQNELDERLKVMCNRDLRKLADSGMITLGADSTLQPRLLGSVMAKHCVDFKTVQSFTRLVAGGVKEVVLLLADSSELAGALYLRANEKKQLGVLNASKSIRFTIVDPNAKKPGTPSKCKTSEMKANLLLQMRAAGHSLGELHHAEFTLLQGSSRVLRALVEYLEAEHRFAPLHASLLLQRSLLTGAGWHDDAAAGVRQLEGVGPQTLEKLREGVPNGVSLQTISELPPSRLEAICGKGAPWGAALTGTARALLVSAPTLAIDTACQQQGSRSLSVRVGRQSSEPLRAPTSRAKQLGQWVLLVGDDTPEGRLMLVRRFSDGELRRQSELSFCCPLPPSCHSVVTALFHTAVCGCDSTVRTALEPQTKQASAASASAAGNPIGVATRSSASLDILKLAEGDSEEDDNGIASSQCVPPSQPSRQASSQRKPRPIATAPDGTKRPAGPPSSGMTSGSTWRPQQSSVSNGIQTRADPQTVGHSSRSPADEISFCWEQFRAPVSSRGTQQPITQPRAPGERAISPAVAATPKPLPGHQRATRTPTPTQITQHTSLGPVLSSRGGSSRGGGGSGSNGDSDNGTRLITQNAIHEHQDSSAIAEIRSKMQHVPSTPVRRLPLPGATRVLAAAADTSGGSQPPVGSTPKLTVPTRVQPNANLWPASWQAHAAPLETEQQARARPHTVPFERKAPAAQYNSARHALEPSAEDEGFALGTPGAVDADFLMGLELPSLPMGSSGSPEASAVGSHLEGDSDGAVSPLRRCPLPSTTLPEAPAEATAAPAPRAAATADRPSIFSARRARPFSLIRAASGAGDDGHGGLILSSNAESWLNTAGKFAGASFGPHATVAAMRVA